ncbi:hypothetical protein RF11_00813 [Thelohanellus kitauei]|uniref:Uncharacterized protein n=1 Tax=Thelohanellus kitauei TaxID=669202 RepID=A0A0C2J7V8_THEKT|nr:hypothetical protein RF11_00813 [Thelohanellus kitauei]
MDCLRMYPLNATAHQINRDEIDEEYSSSFRKFVQADDVSYQCKLSSPLIRHGIYSKHNKECLYICRGIFFHFTSAYVKHTLSVCRFCPLSYVKNCTYSYI